ncbi:MAG: pyridoxal-phosphate dependent enzyme [candidate division KSB1 bacterium]|nr:pyridoxal-phosphate dependent enzyme [candidate division KSB1 bacterium]MDZ7274051.1 pyridoxal-phosphate dependent enzyme [candidate division KSB1 bacterium]MDZ7286423.1 pyridoxal-phosphate dependent enzyme [candidate division KSB1 bacterium]MDZ7296651.1 pyridoxal-phosphate dependent enzyme [candidate division KSB1 bacterium]MDZ7307268.1 pyridoxal-phosphate dependent enzyme [candidate division KSB1 bacterium]
MPFPTLADIRAAAGRIKPYAHRTPVMTCESINHMVGARLFFKCENLQKVGAFKFRGACNAVFSLSDGDLAHGVATHSSGNHAAALALAARLRGAPAFIVMPKTAPRIKKLAVEGYGGRIVFCEPTLAAREAALAQVVAETGATIVHPFNDERVIAGQGTAALELLQEVDELDYVLAPVGGGGLLSGTALAVAGISPKTKVIAAEPAGADDACRSLQQGRIVPSINPQTIADGLLTSLCELTFGIIRRHVDQIVTVSEQNIITAMRHIWERMKIIVEPSAAVVLGALLENKFDFTGKRLGLILSGGNCDLEKLPWLPQ